MTVLFTRRKLLACTLCATSGLLMNQAIATPSSDTLIIYFSRTGTTAGLAEKIAERTAAECIGLELQIPYAQADSEMTDIARNERRSGARREIATVIPDLSAYRNIFIGSPYWWGGLSIPMRTFLSDHPMNGKRVIPFVTSGSSSPAGAWDDIRSLCRQAVIEEGFHVTERSAQNCEQKLEEWLARLGF